MRRTESETERQSSWWLSLLLPPERKAINYVRARGRHTGDVMTREVITINDDASLQEIAALERHRIKRDRSCVATGSSVSSAAPVSCMAWWHVEPVAFVRATDRNLKATVGKAPLGCGRANSASQRRRLRRGGSRSSRRPRKRRRFEPRPRARRG